MNAHQSKLRKRSRDAPFEIRHQNQFIASFGQNICLSEYQQQLPKSMVETLKYYFHRNKSVHFHSQLFGEHNEDEDVSPDTEDPEAVASAGDAALQKESNKEVIDQYFSEFYNKIYEKLALF